MSLLLEYSYAPNPDILVAKLFKLPSLDFGTALQCERLCHLRTWFDIVALGVGGGATGGATVFCSLWVCFASGKWAGKSAVHSMA